MAAPEPIATGSLSATPLSHLLIYLEQKKLSGTLAIWPDPVEGKESAGAPDRVLLLKGVPVAGKLMAKTIALREGLLPLFARNQAPYAFYDTNLLGDDRISGRVDPFALIAAALRIHAHETVIDEVLGRFGTIALGLMPNVDLARYELAPEEHVLVELLRAEPANVAALMASGVLSEERARRVVYLLAITKAIGPADAPQESASDASDEATTQKSAAEPAVSVPPPTSYMPSDPSEPMHSRLDRLHSIPPPPDGLSEAQHQRWLRVVAKGRLVENQNHFEILELDKNAKSNDARNKFYQLAKEWHPDRLPPELSRLREYVQIIFGYMSEASNALGDEDQRIKYLETVREGGGTPATDRLMQTILDTAMEYERVLVLARKHDYDGALKVLKQILTMVKDEPDYHAMYAWLMMQKFPGADAPLPAMLESASKAISLYPRHEKANLLKGQILRRMGKNREALESFRKVTEINPRNIDAMREVRVASMRTDSLAPKGKTPAQGKGKSKKEEPSGVGGLLGKFFKKN